MKLNKVKLCLTMLLSIILLISINNISYGALDFSITSGISSIEVGKTYTVTIKANGITGRFNISHSSNVSIDSSSVWVENGSATIKVTAKSEGKATVTVTPEEGIADSETGDLLNLSSKTDTVTVKAESASTSNGDSNNGSSSGSGSTDTTKPTFTSKKETVYVTDNGINVRSSYSTSSSVLGTLNKGDSLTRTGIATKSVNGILWSKVTYNGKTAYVSSKYLTTTKPKVEEEKPEETGTKEEKSSDTNLKSLEVTPTGLSPAFSNVTTEYTMTVGSDIKKIEVNAIAEDKNAEVSISGNEDLKVGKNTIKIKVTAEDKTERTYVITVTKEQEEQLKLSELLVEGLPLEPEFDENVYEYTINLDKSDISELNITATPSKKSAEIEIVGNTDLKPGENVITILVKSSDGEKITTYQITAKIPEMVQNSATVKNNDLYKYIGIGVIVILIIVITILIRRTKDENIEGEQEELLKLDDEDLPKSLRKNKEIEEQTEKENSPTVEEEQSEKSKKIDELYAMSADDKIRKKGKHF